MSTPRRQVDVEVEAFLRKSLDARLAQCTEPQRSLFTRIYPNGVPGDRLREAIALCDRTISKNNAKPKDPPQ